MKQLMGVGLMVLAAVVAAAGACTQANPRSCRDGSCTDPALPFCDVDGAIGGEAQTCIAVSCTPAALGECRGSTAVTCNSTGNGYDLVECPRGCDPAANGCIAVSCTPGAFSECQGSSEVVCNAAGNDYGVIACDHGCDPASGCLGISCTPNMFSQCQGDSALACNAAGNNYTLTQCAHGCDATSGCRACEPNLTTCANGTLTTCDAAGQASSSVTCALGCFNNQPRCREAIPSNNLTTYLDAVASPPDLIGSNVSIHSFDGAVTVGGQSVSIPSFLLPAAGGAPAIRVLVVNVLDLTDAAFSSGDTAVPDSRHALAILAKGTVHLRGSIIVDPTVGGSPSSCTAGGAGARVDNGVIVTTGGGGGGNATPGGHSGSATFSSAASGSAGPTQGTASIQPLVGGCAGGVYGNVAQANGGGALSLFSLVMIDVNARVDVAATRSYGSISVGGMPAAPGGGAGGNVLLEAPTVSIGSLAVIDGTGGHGGQCPSPLDCSPGGTGATEAAAAGDGNNLVDQSSGGPFASGGGGGGLGRLRINTSDTNYQHAAAAVLHAAVTTGVISSR